MSLLRRLELFYRNHLPGGAGRAAAAALLLAALAAPGAAPILAAPAVVAPLAPQVCGPSATLVTNNFDNGDHSLRGAVACATAGQTVTFSPFLVTFGTLTITLTSGEISIGQSIAIDGSGAPGMIVDAGNNSRVFNISASGPVTLTALTLQRGSVTNAAGGAVYDSSSSALVLNGVNVLSSTVTFGTGGGLYANGPLTLTNSDFISDTSTSNGGGAVAGGAAVVTGGRFERDTCTTGGCSGGAVFGFASLTISGTDFLTNTSLSQGGAAYTLANAVLTNGSFQGNKCTSGGCQGGGLYVNNSLTLTGTEFINNTSTSDGGGAYTLANAVLTNGSFQGNKCTDNPCHGGGLLANGALTMTGTNFISNTSTSDGGGAYALGEALLTNGSFQGNKCTGDGCNGGGLLSASTLTLIGTDFISNTSTSYGGGAWTQGAVLTNGSFQGNKCTGGGCQGGGLFDNAPLTLNGTQIISNTSTGSGGGALATDAALTNGSFQGNKCTGDGCEGGGLDAEGTLALTGTDFISNTSTSDGGGAFTFETAFTGGIFQGNKCTGDFCQGGGVFVDDRLVVTGTRFISNTSIGDGGGAWAFDALLTRASFEGDRCTGAGCQGGGLLAEELAWATSSAFSGNQSAGLGGALAITGTVPLTLTNVTLSGNSAASGGGLYLGGASSAKLYNVTVARNQAASGGGLFVEPGATLRVTNTIIANNTANNCAGTVAAGSHNLEFPGNTCAAAGPSAGFTTADPLLAPLALNPPGTTRTQALLPASPARDHGDPASCANALVNNLDQRGAVRPDAVGEACDIGAYEAGPPDWLVFLPLVRK
jgi:hypothetical protein